MVNEEAVAMLVVHVNDINIMATKKITDSIVADLISPKHLGEVT